MTWTPNHSNKKEGNDGSSSHIVFTVLYTDVLFFDHVYNYVNTTLMQTLFQEKGKVWGTPMCE